MRPAVEGALEVTGQLLTTIGDNPDRLRSEAAFAHLCGVAPIPASSGRTHRHRLNRGGDRAANNAIYTVVLTRLRLDDRTRTHYRRRTAAGLSKREASAAWNATSPASSTNYPFPCRCPRRP
jgi:transposase